MQHLIPLRRAILARESVKIEYTNHGKSDSLRYGRAGFVGDLPTVTRQLREIYGAETVHALKFSDGTHDQHQHIHAIRAVALSLNGFQPDKETEARMVRFLRRLPPVIVKLIPLNRVGFEDFTPYMLLHHEMISSGKCNLASYLDEATEENDRLRRLRVFLACFCLGLIAPHKGSTHGKTSGSKNASVLQRIIQRVREL